MGSCRTATITGALSRISLNDEEEEKGPEGLNYSTLPGNIISKALIQQPSSLGDAPGGLHRAVYLCTDDQPDPQSAMETDYIVMPRGTPASSVPPNDDRMDTLPHDRMMHYKMAGDFGLGPSTMEQFPGEHVQSLPFEPRTAVKNFLAEMEESAGLARSETGSTTSMSSLEVRDYK